MKRAVKNDTTDRTVEKTLAKVQQLLARKDVREMSLQSSSQGTRFTIRAHTKVYEFWLPGASGLIAFGRVIQQQLEQAGAKREHHETP
jgi:hypothetical protein